METITPQAIIALLQSGRTRKVLELLSQQVSSWRSDPEIWLLKAAAHSGLGQLNDVAGCCRSALELDPGNIRAIHNLALAEQKLGMHGMAEAHFADILKLEPDHLPAAIGIAQSLLARNRLDLCIDHLRKSIARLANTPELHLLMGIALHRSNRRDAASDAFRSAIHLRPDMTDAHFHLGNLSLEAGHSEEAVSHYQAALRHNPAHLPALTHLGNAFAAMERHDEAIAAYRKALSIKPDSFIVLHNLARSLLRMHQPEEAASCFRRCIQMQPDHADSLNGLGASLIESGKSLEALPILDRANTLSPDNLAILTNLGYARLQTGQADVALQTLDKALALEPGSPAANSYKGDACLASGRITPSIEAYRKVIELTPRSSGNHTNLGNALVLAGRIDDAIMAYRTALEQDPSDTVAHSNLVFTMISSHHYPAEQVYREHEKWAAAHTSGITPRKHFRNTRDPERKLAIGYLSPDFRSHSVAHFIRPILSCHDRRHFSIHCYSNTAQQDEVTRELRAMTDHWRDTFSMTDDMLAHTIYEDGIDILVDLAGHSRHNRLTVFAAKPAPVQFTYLGYPGTTGLTQIDYRLTDQYCDPPGLSEHIHSERLSRIPGGFLCYSPPRADINTTMPFERNGHITFGSFNNLSKVTTKVIEEWSRVLHGTTDSRLLLKHLAFNDPIVTDNFIKAFSEHGVDSNRLQLIPWIDDPDGHLAAYNQIDIALDTFPYNGTTTTCEALWMGVPVVTLLGDAHAGRVGASLLTQLGLRALIGESPQDYRDIACSLAEDHVRRGELRNSLRRTMLSSRLCDGTAFTMELETVYRNSWHAWCHNVDPNRMN